MKTLTAIVLLALAGCAQTTWVKPGTTAADVKLMKFDCESIASIRANTSRTGNSFGDDFAHGMVYQEVFDDCMSAHGFEEVNVK